MEEELKKGIKSPDPGILICDPGIHECMHKTQHTQPTYSVWTISLRHGGGGQQEGSAGKKRKEGLIGGVAETERAAFREKVEAHERKQLRGTEGPWGKRGRVGDWERSGTGEKKGRRMLSPFVPGWERIPRSRGRRLAAPRFAPVYVFV